MATAASPNVVVFFTDQQRWDCSGLHGCPLDLMPNFDRMARQGTHIAQSFTCQPVCGPARSCLQSGLYATASGCYRNGIPLPGDDLPTLAKQFNASGYHTGYIGKWHLADETSPGPVRKEQRGGYQEWLASNIQEFTSDAYLTTLYDNECNPVKLPGYRVDAVADATIRFLDRNQKKPFFLFTSYIEPHHQNCRDDYPAPDGYAERYQGRWMPPDLAALGGNAHQHLAGYYGMVKRLDEALGRVLDALKSLGLSENTIVLFSSDHGCHFKTRNGEYKRSCHDASIRVPTALIGPGFQYRGTGDHLISLIDLPPTLLDAAGLAIPPGMQGRSILPLIHGKTKDWPEEVFVQVSESQVGRAVRTRRWKYGVVAADKHAWNDSCSDHYAETYLYDLKADPYELKNLAGAKSHRRVAEVMKSRLLRRMEQAGENTPVIHDAPDCQPGVFAPSEAEALQ